MHAPRTNHLQAVGRILRYLKGSLGQGVMMKKNDIMRQLDKTMPIGWAVKQIGSPLLDIVHLSEKIQSLQRVRNKMQLLVQVRKLNIEISFITNKLIWFRALLNDLGFGSPQPMKLFSDNQVPIHIASTTIFHERTTYIEVNCHFVQENVQDNTIQMMFVKSGEQLADILTKCLFKTQFQNFLFKLVYFNILALA